MKADLSRQIRKFGSKSQFIRLKFVLINQILNFSGRTVFDLFSLDFLLVIGSVVTISLSQERKFANYTVINEVTRYQM